MYICIYVYMYICIYVYMYIYIYICMVSYLNGRSLAIYCIPQQPTDTIQVTGALGKDDRPWDVS